MKCKLCSKAVTGPDKLRNVKFIAHKSCWVSLTQPEIKPGLDRTLNRIMMRPHEFAESMGYDVYQLAHALSSEFNPTIEEIAKIARVTGVAIKSIADSIARQKGLA